MNLRRVELKALKQK